MKFHGLSEHEKITKVVFRISILKIDGTLVYVTQIPWNAMGP